MLSARPFTAQKVVIRVARAGSIALRVFAVAW